MAQPSTAYVPRGQNELLLQGDIGSRLGGNPGESVAKDFFRSIKEENFDLFNRLLVGGG